VKFGVTLGALNPGLHVQITELADRLGFESVWMPEHLVFPVEMTRSPYPGQEHPPVPPQTPVHDVFAYLSFMAGRTERIRLGSHVYNIGLRHPFIAARAVTTLDVVSGGRAIFGVGASWLESVTAAIAELRRLRDEMGRGDEPFEITCGAPISSPDDVERLAKLGVDRLLVAPWRRSREAVEGIQAFAATHLAGA
jgi:alkanesulfonate monooxygenase SsuD/methylene tetrahydromethanopterin reductase-like flavin-dependent oxidoreductase (luciferase family)